MGNSKADSIRATLRSKIHAKLPTKQFIIVMDNAAMNALTTSLLDKKPSKNAEADEAMFEEFQKNMLDSSIVVTLTALKQGIVDDLKLLFDKEGVALSDSTKYDLMTMVLGKSAIDIQYYGGEVVTREDEPDDEYWYEVFDLVKEESSSSYIRVSEDYNKLYVSAAQERAVLENVDFLSQLSHDQKI